MMPQTLYPANFVDFGGNSQSRRGNSGHRATNAWRGKAQSGQEEDLQEGTEIGRKELATDEHGLNRSLRILFYRRKQRRETRILRI
jgi:hypothetical protein